MWLWACFTASKIATGNRPPWEGWWRGRSGTFSGFAVDKQRDKARDIAGTISEGKFDAAYQASAKGPIPTDPEVREATARLVRYRLERLDRQRWLNLPVFGLFSLLGVYLALTSAPLWWLSVALFVSMPLIIHLQTNRIRSRAALLGII